MGQTIQTLKSKHLNFKLNKIHKIIRTVQKLTSKSSKKYFYYNFLCILLKIELKKTFGKI